jgi:protein TonB
MLLTAFPRVCRAATCAAVLLAGALGSRLAQAQSPVELRYFGPRYPGGPDSLRATIGRALRTANPAWVGNVAVQLQLGADGDLQKIRFLPPSPGTPAAKLARNAEVRDLTMRMANRLLHWQQSPGNIRLSSWEYDTKELVLPFGSTEPAPLAYSEQEPIFTVPGESNKTLGGVTNYVRRAVRYSAEDLRARREGVVYAYFERNGRNRAPANCGQRQLHPRRPGTTGT